MPLREFGCAKAHVTELFFHTTRIEAVPKQVPCRVCGASARLMFSMPNLDTAASFHAFHYKGPDGRSWDISNLHMLRQVEKAYGGTYNVRFDAYSAEPNNPDEVDGMGLPYWSGDDNETSGKAFSSPLPVRDD